MNTKTKRLLVGGLAVASLAIWIPHIMGMISAEATPVDTVMPALSGDLAASAAPPMADGASSPRGAELSPAGAASPGGTSPSMPSGSGSTAGGPMPGGADAGAPMPGAQPVGITTPVASAAGTASMTELLSSLKASVDTIKQSQGSGGHQSLEDLATAYSRKHEAAPVTTATEQRPEPRTEPSATASPDTPKVEPVATRGDDTVRDFVRAQDVRMILLAPDKKLACLGSNLVQEGDELLAGRVVVRRIERTYVVLVADGHEVRVNLRAFEPHATSSTSSGPASKASSAPAAAPSSAPAATPAAAPAGAASTPLPKGV